MIALLLALLFGAPPTKYPTYHRGQSFSLALPGLPPYVRWLSASLTSDCDSEYVITSDGNRRAYGKYLADFTVPSDAEPCRFTLTNIEFQVSGDDTDVPDSVKPVDVHVEVER